MKILMLCGVFAKENEQEVIANAKRPVEFSANVFQTKLIQGFRQANLDLQVISAPFIGSFPNASKVRYFSQFKSAQDEYTYVPFLNYWGIRNFSRAASLKKTIEGFAKRDDSQKLIVVYSAHTPFLDAAVYAKKKDPGIKICLVIPDLPQYMNLNSKISFIYRLGKLWDISRFNKLLKHADSFVLLTEEMKNVLRIGDKPYRVVEGIVDRGVFAENESRKQLLKNSEREEKYIVYTGKMNERFGVKDLVDAFSSIKDSALRLILCGSGDCDGYVFERAKMDSRIIALGQIPHEEALDWILKADVLVNPRRNNEAYTKYSFPSKTIEYLASGSITIGYMLDGMPPIYKELLVTVDDEGLAETLKKALLISNEKWAEKYCAIKQYLQTLCAKSVAEAIYEITFLGANKL